MKKNLVLTLFSIILVVCLCSACFPFGMPVANQQQNVVNSQMSIEGFPEDFKSLLNKFETSEYVVADQRFEVLSGVVGANYGCRYVANFNNQSFNVELYYYDPLNPLEGRDECINSINQNGYFTIMDKEVPSVVSDNKKYMLVYGDTRTDETSASRRQEVYDVLKSFN